MIRRPDRDQLRADMRALFGEDRPVIAVASKPEMPREPEQRPQPANEKAGNGRKLTG